MSSPAAKRVKTDADAPYELIYWPGIPGRGELIRILFEDAGVAYTDRAKTSSSKSAASVVLGYMSSDGDADDGTNPPVFAPPILKHGDVVISQTPNILLYLAQKLGYCPTEGAAVFHLNEIVLTLLDGFVNEVHETHHPIAVSRNYEDQKEEAKARSADFIDERLPKYLGYVQRLIDAKTSGEGPWLYGDKLTYADLVFYQCINGTNYAFPRAVGMLKQTGKYDGVFKLRDEVEKRPNIKAYLGSDRRIAYSDGIWRRYEELDVDLGLSEVNKRS